MGLQSGYLMKSACYLAIILVLAAVYLSESRLALLTVLLVLAAYFSRYRLVKALLLLSVALAVVVLLDYVMHLGVLENFARFRQENARLGVWYAGLARWTDHPVLGDTCRVGLPPRAVQLARVPLAIDKAQG